MVRIRGILCILLMCGVVLWGTGLTAVAAAPEGAGVTDLNRMECEAVGDYQKYTGPDASTRSTNRFDFQVSAHSTVAADFSFFLEAGEAVTIDASYSPRTASVDFGVIDSDGLFHYINVASGGFSETIYVDTRGEYTLAVRNNSSSTVSVVGFVEY